MSPAEAATEKTVPIRATRVDPVRHHPLVPTRLPSGASPAIRSACELIRQVAAHESTVLLLGESGTGKEVAARAIHDLSPRSRRPFVAINCGAIPCDLLESELFGHEKGAFTGALHTRKGRFEIADGGTIFLDEIGDMSPPMQVKLLRVLQERVFQRVGDHTLIRSNVRVIAATHRDLEEAITTQRFREDLYHRLNVFPIEMPALRSRIEDLPVLVQEFITQNVAAGRGEIWFCDEALSALAQHPWTGNIRELANLIERLSILRAGRLVRLTDLPAKYQYPATCDSLAAAGNGASSDPAAPACQMLTHASCAESAALADPPHPWPEELAPSLDSSGTLAHLPQEGMDLKTYLCAVERTLIKQALQRSQGIVAEAARLLHMQRTTLVEKLKRLQLGVDMAMP
jgi:sigma-54 dependent transcriptional regulator, flagellar regulatory protein